MSEEPFEQYRTLCKCGHDKSTHFALKGACLGMRCDDCVRYVSEWDTKTDNRKLDVVVKPGPKQLALIDDGPDYDVYDDDYYDDPPPSSWGP